MSKEDVARKIFVEPDLEKHVERLKHFEELGFYEVYLFNVNQQQERFIDDFGEQVLPVFSHALVGA